MINFKKLCSNLIPSGLYKAQVTDVKFAAGTASKSILVTLTILEGPFAKRVITDTISEKAFGWRLMPFLKACNVDVEREYNTDEELMRYGFATAKGKTVKVEIGQRTYNGTDYNNVTDYAPLDASVTTAEEVLDAFDTTPEVKGNSLDGMVEEETNIPEEVPATEEPTLDVDLDDLDNPF